MKHSTIKFPYKSFAATRGIAYDSCEPDETFKPFSEYYLSLYDKYEDEILKKANLVKNEGEYDLSYFALVPVKVITCFVSRVSWLREYVTYFLGMTGKKPEYPLVDIYDMDTFERGLLEDIFCLKVTFRKMSDGKLRPCGGCYDKEETFVQEIDFAFTRYVNQFEIMGDDAVWDVTLRLRTLWRDMIFAILDIVFKRVDDDQVFDAVFGKLRSAFQDLPPVLYKLECRRCQELTRKTGSLVYRPDGKKDIGNLLNHLARKFDVATAKTHAGLRSIGAIIPDDFEGICRGKWAKGWHGEMIDKVFSSYLNSTGEPFDKICRQVYGAHKQEFDGKGESYDAFKRACDRKKKKAKKRTK